MPLASAAISQLTPVKASLKKGLPGSGSGGAFIAATTTDLSKVDPPSVDLLTRIVALASDEHCKEFPVQCTDSTKTFPAGSTVGATGSPEPGIGIGLEKVWPPSVDRVKSSLYPRDSESRNVT